MSYEDGRPLLLPIKRDGRVVARRWGFDYRRLFRTRRDARIARRRERV